MPISSGEIGGVPGCYPLTLTKIAMSEKNLSILIGGLAGGLLAVLLSLPQNQFLGCLACLSYVGCGLVAVWHYTNTNTLTIAGGEGAGIGALAGVVGGVVSSLLGWFFRMIGLLPGTEEAIQQLEDSGQLDQMDENTAEMMYQFIEFSTGIGGVVISVIIAVILGVIGGAIGAAVFKKGGDAPVDASDVV